MSTSVTINGQTFAYPSTGQSPGWGNDASDAFIALVGLVNNLQSPTDILLTQYDVADNVTSASIVNGLAFDSSVRSANVYYSVYRVSADTPSGNSETGTLMLVYDPSAASGSKWAMRQDFVGNAGIAFTVTDAGQIYYQTTQIDNGGGSYSGVMKFSAKTIGV